MGVLGQFSETPWIGRVLEKVVVLGWSESFLTFMEPKGTLA